MADGESDAGDPADGEGRRPLPPEDRVWRHPAEVAMEARRTAAHRRGRRVRATVTLIGGAAVAATGLLWLTSAGPTSVAVRSEFVALPAAPVLAAAAAEVAATTSTSLAHAVYMPASAATELLTIRSKDDSKALAGALPIRDGYLITSGRAIGDARNVTITWDDQRVAGVVIGYDAVTDISVIRVDADPPGGDRTDSTGVVPGDEVRLADPDSTGAVRTVVDLASTSARQNGDPVVGIVELDHILGTTLPGSPAFDPSGAIVGMLTATADDAPAAIVPIHLVRAVAAEIIDLGAATHPWLGVRAVNPVDDRNRISGSLVTEVDADGPAAAGGVEVGDLIVAIDDTTIDSMESMVATLRSYEPGDDVVVMVLRHDEPVMCPVALDSHVDDAT